MADALVQLNTNWRVADDPPQWALQCRDGNMREKASGWAGRKFVRNRDHLRRLGRGVVYRLAVAALLRSAGPALDLTTLAGELTSRGFDREQEQAADRFGLELIHAEYGHVAAAADFFGRRGRHEGRVDDLAIYLSTHPGSDSRASEILEEARRRGWAVEGTLVVLD